ncbi:hypothetical protein [Miltoncostaea marina]|uniref:hypothetical protein n=1 Tax=Miltoncostaea marina TaxID=2843215 RepID=UPI001C3DE9E6|nr:hypothetical protein [Miltoncostaea marina]
MSTLPPQRRQAGGAGGGPGGRPARTNLSPREGAEEAERRTGLPTFHAGQRVQGMFGCVACQFQIRNRGPLPTCPQCGEIIWAYLEGGPRPVPEGEDAAAPPAAAQGEAPSVAEGVKIDAPQVKVESVKLEP